MIVIQTGYSPTRPLTQARICYDTITRDGSLSASGEQVGFEADAAVNSLTYESWKPDALPATWRIDAGSAVDVDYVAIASHTLGTDGATVKVQRSDNDADWTDVTDATVTPTDDSPILFLFTSESHRYWRIHVSGSTVPTIGVVYIGEELAMTRPIYGGHSPLDMSRNTVVRPMKSERGQFLGRSIVRTGFSTGYSWTNLDPTFYRNEFDPFVESARSYPFFIAWRPSGFLNDVGYVWTTSDIKPTNSGVRGFMQVSIDVEGLGID